MRGDLTIRKTRTASGATAVQVVRNERRGRLVVKHIGSAHDEAECEALMARAGAEGTPVFLIGGKPEVLAETAAKLRQQWNVNLVGTQDGYFTPDERPAPATARRSRRAYSLLVRR